MAISVGDPEFRLVVADWQTPLGEVDTYESATIEARYNDISSWELTLPGDSADAQLFVNATRPRLILYARGQVFRSGPAMRLEREAGVDGDLLTISGVDDLVWLRRRVAHPQPGTAAPPYNAQAYDVASGLAATVIAGYVNRNLGPLAVPNRQVPGLTVPAPPAIGPNVAVQARYDNLLDFVRGIAKAAGLGIEVRDLAFNVFQPTGTAIFSVDLGTMAGWNSAVEAPDVNFVYVAGSGEGTARLIREYQDTTAVLDWGRIEGFQDRRDTTDTAELDQAGAQALADGVHPTTVQMETIDTPAQEFLTDWSLGSLATATIGGVQVQDVIAEVRIELTGNTPPIVTPVLGGPAADLALFRRLNRADRRIRQLERI